MMVISLSSCVRIMILLVQQVWKNLSSLEKKKKQENGKRLLMEKFQEMGLYV